VEPYVGTDNEPSPKVTNAFLCDKGFDTIHTKDLPNGNDTIHLPLNLAALASSRGRVSSDLMVVVRDAAFFGVEA